jgi:very-short-patch-repair endonuclease
MANVICKNPTCEKSFDLFPSEIGRKLYCSRECRSEHHWAENPILEKRCKNPSCDKFIKRKFRTTLDKVHYCSSECKKDHKKSTVKNSTESKCKICQTMIITTRQDCGKLVPRTMCDNCLLELRRNNAIKRLEEISVKMKYDLGFQEKIKIARKKQGELMRRRYKEHGLSPAWIDWYKNFSSFGRSSIEDAVVSHIKNKVNKIERWYPISNMFVDIYLPEKNLVIECQGDYWHMNPQKYSATDYNKTIKRTAAEQWEKDKNRRLYMEYAGYKVVELWESEINAQDYSKLDIYL